MADLETVCDFVSQVMSQSTACAAGKEHKLVILSKGIESLQYLFDSYVMKLALMKVKFKIL
jgi:hypothetical protein